MKVVIFCGGQGMRLREEGQNTPKPLARIGQRPFGGHRQIAAQLRVEEFDALQVGVGQLEW